MVRSVGIKLLATSSLLLSSLFSAPATSRQIEVDHISNVDEIVEVLHGWKQQYKEQQSHEPRPRPFVTAAFAQSLNGKIGFRASSNYPLSCQQSLIVTHALRSMHDGILVGGRTFWLDNPRLTNRLWKMEELQQPHQPVPIVLDTHLTYLKRLLKASSSSSSSINARNLIVCCSHESAQSFALDNRGDETDDHPSLPVNIRLLPCEVVHERRHRRGVSSESNEDYLYPSLDWQDVLSKLYNEFNVKSLMVEGGATILSSLFLHQQTHLVDALCITIAPLVIDERKGLPLQYISSDDEEDRGMNYADADANASVLNWTGMSPKFYSVGTDALFLTQWAKPLSDRPLAI